MALKKQVIFKGFPAEYWNIQNNYYDKQPNITHGIIFLYKDEQSRDADEKNNWLKALEYRFSGELTRAQAYIELPKSVPQTRLVTPAVEAIYNDDGTIETPAQAAVYETIETNELFGAEPLLD
jgi:hypothetical protein